VAARDAAARKDKFIEILEELHIPIFVEIALALEVKNFFVEIFWCGLNWPTLNCLTGDTRKSKYKVSAFSRPPPRIEFTIMKTRIFQCNRKA
jgi:hypothetical protein